MKKKLLLSMVVLSCMSAYAQYVDTQTDSIHEESSLVDETLMKPLLPTYLSQNKDGFGWDRNWFVEAKGGCSAFLGTPIGCGDLFDRTSPVVQVGVGKWFSPSIGGRIEFQGMKFKNANQQMMSYQSIHADFLYNVTGTLGQNEQGISRWNLIPFAGVGIIRNADWRNGCVCPGVMSNNHPFAFDYGVQVGYRVSNRLHLIAEISGVSTTQSFDMVGKSAKFGDTMLNLSAGLSFTIGKAGWKRTIDARPFITQNEYLMSHNHMLEEQLHNCQESNSTEDSVSFRNKNNYRGLVSLKMRLNNMLENSDGSVPDDRGQLNANDGIQGVDSLTNFINVPVYFYFNINTTTLVDASQLSNLDELVQIARLHNLRVSVTGAADSATGNEAINDSLSEERAKYITKEMMNRGVPRENFHVTKCGGINKFGSNEANRFTVVTLTR